MKNGTSMAKWMRLAKLEVEIAEGRKELEGMLG